MHLGYLMAVILLAAMVYPAFYEYSALASTIDKGNLEYDISGGDVSSIEADEAFSSVTINLNTSNNGELTIDVPREFMDAKIGNADDDFFVLVDGQEVIPEEEKTDQKRTLTISFDRGAETVEIIGTSLDISALSKSEPMPSEPAPSEPVESPQEAQETQPSDGGGCLIATATYGSELSEQVQSLRETREMILQTQAGSSFMTAFNQVYYSFSPHIADLERDNPVFKEVVKAYITPMIASLSVLDTVEADSEGEVLFYGSLVIAMNLGMYVAAPTLTVMAARKYSRSRN